MTHPWHDVVPGEDLPHRFTAVIEIPRGSSVKYELDKATGLLCLDRVLYAASIPVKGPGLDQSQAARLGASAGKKE